MKILTLWQFWASMISLGHKTYETRSFSTNYRGTILIHSAKKKPTQDIRKMYEWVQEKISVPDIDDLPYGEVVAIAHLGQCFRTPPSSQADEGLYLNVDQLPEIEKMLGDYSPGRFAWAFSNVQAITPSIPWKGMQGLMNAPEELQEMVRQTDAYSRFTKRTPTPVFSQPEVVIPEVQKSTIVSQPKITPIVSPPEEQKIDGMTIKDYTGILQQILPGLDGLTIVRIESRINQKPEWVTPTDARFSNEMLEAMKAEITRLQFSGDLYQDDNKFWRLRNSAGDM